MHFVVDKGIMMHNDDTLQMFVLFHSWSVDGSGMVVCIAQQVDSELC
jgi:hypothetical protein